MKDHKSLNSMIRFLSHKVFRVGCYGEPNYLVVTFKEGQRELNLYEHSLDVIIFAELCVEAAKSKKVTVEVYGNNIIHVYNGDDRGPEGSKIVMRELIPDSTAYAKACYTIKALFTTFKDIFNYGS